MAGGVGVLYDAGQEDVPQRRVEQGRGGGFVASFTGNFGFGRRLRLRFFLGDGLGWSTGLAFWLCRGLGVWFYLVLTPGCRFDDRLPRALRRIEHFIGKQFQAVIYQEPEHRVGPDEASPFPAERGHEQTINRNQSRNSLGAKHGDQ